MPAARHTPAPLYERPKAAKKQCPHCERVFSRTEHLERHVRAHTHERPFECPICEKSYSRRDTLLRHQRNHASNDSAGSNVFAPPGEAASASSSTDAATQNTPSSYESEQIYSTSRVDGFNATRPDQAVATSQFMNMLSMNSLDGAISLNTNAHAEAEFDNPMNVSVGNAEYNLDFDFGQDFPSWLSENTVDVQTMFYPLSMDHMQSLYNISTGPNVHFDITSDANPELERLWFTHIRPTDGSQHVSGTVTPSEPRQEVDEDYRQTMRNSVEIRSLDTTLPSSDFINLCIRLYFTRFHSKFPIIHIPTFQPSKTNSMLLLSICSIGSIISGTAKGKAQGFHIWEILNKAVLAKWERLVARETEDQLPIIQACLLGQTFALLCGDPKHIARAEFHHGSLIAWARRSKMFQLSHKHNLQPTALSQDIDLEWRKWAREEEQIRTALGLYLHDAELCHIFHHEPLLRPARRVSYAASEELFSSRSSKEWLHRLQQRFDVDSQELNGTSSHSLPETNARRIEHASKFTRSIQLHGISAVILEERLSGRLDDAAKQNLTNELLDFQKQQPSFSIGQDAAIVETEILWHLSFLSMCTDFDLLERILGRDGPPLDVDQQRVRTWAASPDALRAIIHVRIIRQKLEALPISLVPAVHLPRAVFFAAVCCYCAFTFNYAGANSTPSTADFIELRASGNDPNGSLCATLGVLETKEMLCYLADIIHRLGHWEIARKFGAIIEALLRRILV